MAPSVAHESLARALNIHLTDSGLSQVGHRSVLGLSQVSLSSFFQLSLVRLLRRTDRA